MTRTPSSRAGIAPSRLSRVRERRINKPSRRSPCALCPACRNGRRRSRGLYGRPRGNDRASEAGKTICTLSGFDSASDTGCGTRACYSVVLLTRLNRPRRAPHSRGDRKENSRFWRISPRMSSSRTPFRFSGQIRFSCRVFGALLNKNVCSVHNHFVAFHFVVATTGLFERLDRISKIAHPLLGSESFTVSWTAAPSSISMGSESRRNANYHLFLPFHQHERCLAAVLASFWGTVLCTQISF